ncbi:membrane protein [Alicyclobacillus contaminans]|uniref:trimeric intracellular cation channel family protein n=1 Tax=Alicyclobacillus contaminans TaxID=392016 RepID=UPI00047BDA43|nr:trimeric intracellular cation channel family protein [Alicyclobacillus contaminans]GMA51083.1 membrane protein [Alicyclobacillus contaminans]
MTWYVLTIIGTIAFALSGAIVAMEEEYDVFGVVVLAMVTAFGGGLLRNLMIGLPVSDIWNQGALFNVALASALILILLPTRWIHHWLRFANMFDALGLSAFTIQGALYAASMKYPVGMVVVAAVITGIGGGVIRDVLAGRKPIVLRAEVYALWAMVAGAAIGFHVVNPSRSWQLYALLLVVFTLRMLSLAFGWHVPRRRFRAVPVPSGEEDAMPPSVP